MHQKPMPMNAGNLIAATEQAQRRVQSWCARAKAVAEDTQRDERLAAHECKACFYATRIGGAAMTTRPCMACGQDQRYSSTATDALCLACAQEHHLCKRCGGDLELNGARADWPVGPAG